MSEDHSVAVMALMDAHRTEIQTIVDAYTARISAIERDKCIEVHRLQRALDLVKGHNKHLMASALAHSDCPKDCVCHIFHGYILAYSRRAH